MAKILDPDELTQGVEVEFLTGSREIRLNTAGFLSTDGVSMQALYSFIKEEWRTDDNLIKFPFPMLSITSEQFELINGWDLSGSFSKYLIRDAGWALKAANGDSAEEWMNITTLGTFVTPTDQAYFVQNSGSNAAPANFQLTDVVNQGVQVYSSGSSNYDYRDYFAVFLREQSKIYGYYNLNTEQNIAELTYRKYALPLTNANDLKITADDTTISGSAPYNGMTIAYYTASQARTIGAASFDFNIIINGNSGTAEQIYEFVQWSLRQDFDIDSGSAVRRGSVAPELLQFIGDTLRTKYVSPQEGLPAGGGVFIDNFQSVDTNRIEFTDNTNAIRTFPFVAAGTIFFNDNLRNDSNSIFKVFFTNDDSGSNTGRDFGTDTAIIIDQYNGGSAIPLTGSVGTSASFAFDYDYDNNIQRGSSSSGSDAPFTAVALGLGTAQYTVTTGNIIRSTANTINFVAALERNYLNP
jgi:hypothetical protein